MQFDLPGALRRIRRLADLSQRQLAEALGTPHSAVSQAEAGRRGCTVDHLVRAAALADLRLALLDAEGREAAPMTPGSARDRAGRRFPAHLDTRPSDIAWWHGTERYSREQPDWTFDLDRWVRDDWRRRVGTPIDHDVPGPGDTVAGRAAARLRAAEQQHREQVAEHLRQVADGQREPPWDLAPCSCPAECDELLLGALSGTPPGGQPPPLHVDTCRCGCDIG